MDTFEKNLIVAIEKAPSLEEIEAWLRSQPGIASVERKAYLLKSNPPQREFIVNFIPGDGSATQRKALRVFDLGNRRFRFHEMCEV